MNPDRLYTIACKNVLKPMVADVRQLPEDGNNLVVAWDPGRTDASPMLRKLFGRGRCVVQVCEYDAKYTLLRSYLMDSPSLVCFAEEGDQVVLELDGEGAEVHLHEKYGEMLSDQEDKDALRRAAEQRPVVDVGRYCRHRI